MAHTGFAASPGQMADMSQGKQSFHGMLNFANMQSFHTISQSNRVSPAAQDMAMAPGSDRLQHHDAASSSEPSVAPPLTPHPTAPPMPGPHSAPDASQASSASDQTAPAAHTSTLPGQGQVDRDRGESSEASNGASSQQLQGDSPKARWSQVSIAIFYVAVVLYNFPCLMGVGSHLLT